MDIVDNSISAGATTVLIELELRVGMQATAAGSIAAIRVYDNGSGMSVSGIENALEIGPNVEYEGNSLSKFGLGLKSAGFSLGRRISVTSKTRDEQTASRYVDRDVIREMNNYGVCSVELARDPEWLAALRSGTIVEVSKTPGRQDSAAKCARELRSRLGAVYKYFLARDAEPLILMIQIGPKEPETIAARDVLAREDAILNFDADKYDASRPCIVYDGTVNDDLFSGEARIGLAISVFPMDKMKNYAGFSEEAKRRVASYDIKRDNLGFYFYRNGRLIRWGDRLDIASRDDINFRAEINFGTAHDDYFQVDVSKQNLELNEEFLDNLEKLCRTPLKSAREIMKKCSAMLDQGTGLEGESFNERTEVFSEEDPSDLIAPVEPDVKIARRRLREELLKVEEEIADGPGSNADQEAATEESPSSVFQRIRYTDKMMSLDLAAAGFDTINGTYVRINRNHPFYQLVINHFEPQSAERLALEALLWSSAVAESKTFENVSVDPSTINQVLSHLRHVFSATTNAWALGNQDVF